MSMRWQCAVCESVNDGGDSCSACGATVTGTAIRATAAPETPARQTTAHEDDQRGIPVRELPVREPGTELPDGDPYDAYDFLVVPPPLYGEDGHEAVESIDVRPRVRVYGCCLPICLGTLLVVVGTATAVAKLVIQAL